MKFCICGCGAEVVSTHKKAIFASQHSKAERVKLKYRINREKACTGMLAPVDWRTCVSCGYLFPIFQGIHNSKELINTCPAFVSKSCGPKYRLSKKGNHYKRSEDDKDFRPRICIIKNVSCQGYSGCSDREFALDPSDRKWEFEKYGKNCYH